MARRRRPPRPGALSDNPPFRILTQLLVLQTLFYLALLLLTLFACLIAGSAPFSLDLVLGWRAVRGDTTQGWLMGFLLVLAGGFFKLVLPLLSMFWIMLTFGVTVPQQ